MFKTTNLFGLIFSSALGIVTLIGCQPSTTSKSPQSTGSHKHAETYAEALAELDKLRTNIETNFKEGTSDLAHNSLHDAGHILEELPALAKKEGISGADFEKVKQAADRAFKAFGELDTFHGEQNDLPPESDASSLQYEKVADDIHSSFQDLHAKAAATHSADHEHDEADHLEHDETDAHDGNPQANSAGEKSTGQEQGSGQE
jgi:hypothetical protein